MATASEILWENFLYAETPYLGGKQDEVNKLRDIDMRMHCDAPVTGPRRIVTIVDMDIHNQIPYKHMKFPS